MTPEWKLNLKALDNYVASEGGGRWELSHNAYGVVFIRFINKHGSVFDVQNAADFAFQTKLSAR